MPAYEPQALQPHPFVCCVDARLRRTIATTTIAVWRTGDVAIIGMRERDRVSNEYTTDLMHHQ